MNNNFLSYCTVEKNFLIYNNSNNSRKQFSCRSDPITEFLQSFILFLPFNVHFQLFKYNSINATFII